MSVHQRPINQYYTDLFRIYTYTCSWSYRHVALTAVVLIVQMCNAGIFFKHKWVLNQDLISADMKKAPFSIQTTKSSSKIHFAKRHTNLSSILNLHDERPHQLKVEDQLLQPLLVVTVNWQRLVVHGRDKVATWEE